MENFPLEILIDIMCRLPVKDLLRYRCVSKPWRSLIDGPDFVKMHLKRSTETYTNFSLLLANHEGFFGIDLDVPDAAVKLERTPDNRGIHTDVVGSCNGLIALANVDRLVTLWNPSTRRYGRTNCPKIHLPPRSYLSKPFIYGFGHDAINDDYKVVRVVRISQRLTNEPESNKVVVYSAKSNAWKSVSNFPYYFVCWSQPSVFASNALHWVLSRNPNALESSLVVAFDLVTEEHREVPLPDHKALSMRVGVLGGSLCVVFDYLWEAAWSYYPNYVTVWLMKEYGVKESWTKLSTVVRGQLSSTFTLEHAEPIAFLKTGKQVLMQVRGDKLISFDLEKENTKNVTFTGAPMFVKTTLCVGSLVGLGGNDGQFGWKTDRRQRRGIRIRRRGSFWKWFC